ncbi:MAG: response regulator [Candidatus Omnitrophica bacterium]|nr:response regulator [Candidatus Omnitrophota bacterium]
MTSAPRRLLIVEDEQDLCDCLEQFFSSKGFDVRCAFSGEEALERLQADPPDIVLLDILLPGLSGLEVLKQARARYPGMRFIMVSSADEQAIRQTATLFGACAFVAKPFDFSEHTWAPVFAA